MYMDAECTGWWRGLSCGSVKFYGKEVATQPFWVFFLRPMVAEPSTIKSYL